MSFNTKKASDGGKAVFPDKKKTLFDDEEEGEITQEHKLKKRNKQDNDGFKINEEFARRFEHNKRRQLLEQAKEKYGERALLDNDDDNNESEEEEEEDDEGELINANVEKKFLETIAMIRTNDPKLKQVEGELFKDEDFEGGDGEDEGQKSRSKDKKMTYKDQIRADVLKKVKKEGDSSDDEDESDDDSDSNKKEHLFKKKSKGETLAEEEARLKREFKKAALVESEASNEESDEDESDGFLKKKGGEDNEDNESSEESEVPDDLLTLKTDKVLTIAQKKAKKELNMVTDKDLLQRFYGNEAELDQTDKFLRNYILLQCWKDKGNKSSSKLQQQIDQEDEQRDEERDAFEQQYNFRFEEGTGAYLTTHQREVQDSMRRKDDKRKDKRDEKKERMEEEKRRKQEELNKIKQIKRDEILEKLKKAEFVAGTKITAGLGSEKKLLEKLEKELKTEFIPELYDKAMEKMFDEKYYK